MKIFIIVIVCTYSISILATCLCSSTINNSNIVIIDNFKSNNGDMCLNRIKNRLLMLVDDLAQCRKDRLSITWGCQKTVRLDKKIINVDCQKLFKVKRTIELQNTIATMKQSILKMKSPILCEGNDHNQTLASANSSKYTPKENLDANFIQLEFKNKIELKNALSHFIPGKILDRPDDGFEFFLALPNDNNALGIFDYILKTKSGDDLGYTHGMEVKIGKKLQGSGYFVTLEYSSKLYTERIPGIKNFFDSKSKRYVVPQQFLEENILQLVVDNMKENKAFYFKTGIGIHNLNQNNSRGILISAAQQQSLWHKAWSKKFPDKIKMYDYRGNGSNKYGVILDIDIGKKGTIYRDNKTRVQYNALVGSRGSTLKGASSLRSNLELTGDYQSSSNSLAYRISAGLSGEIYFSGEKYLTKYISIESGGNNHKVGFKYEIKQQKDGPAYLVHDKIDVAIPSRNTIGTIYYVYNY